MTDRTIRDLVQPIWRGASIADESVVFVSGASGVADAVLLFEPQGPVTITDVARTLTYEPSRDYVVDPPRRRIVRTESSRLPAVQGDEPEALDPAHVLRYLTLVSYEHASDAWTGYAPPDRGADLPRLLDRLRQRQPVSLCVLGDSIAEGYDATGFHDTAPRQPAFAALVVAGLESRFGGSVALRNHAVAGSTSEHGRWVAEEAASQSPDLVLVAFGMNDACYAEAEEFSAHIADIMRRVHAISADTEFLLVSPMRPTAACTWVSHERFTRYRDALLGFTRSGVAVADVTHLWDTVLARKRPRDLSGNGSNHPNDFGHRLYAQTILETIGARGGEPVAPPRSPSKRS